MTKGTTKVDTKVTRHQAAISLAMQWDPSDNKEGYKASCDNEAVVSVVKDYLEELKVKVPDDADLHPDIMPAINTALLIFGKVEVDDYLKLITSGDKCARGKYYFALDSGKKFVEASEEIVKAMHQINVDGKAKSLAPTVTTLKVLSKTSAKAVDSILATVGNPSFNDIVNAFNNGGTGVSQEMLDAIDMDKAEIARLQSALSAELAKPSVPIEMTVESDGTIPDGKMTMVKASTLFKGIDLTVDMEVPFWTWDGVHPDVPKEDPHYIFRAKELSTVLYALVTNKRCWLQGHTGSGKTTLLEQVAARLNYPFARVNFDSEITRADLIGRDTLKTEGGVTVSEFVEGMLPRMMRSPYMGCFDEIDFARPDVAYVMQAALEGNALRITEDGDRLVKPNPMFRMFATGNTVGQGDEHGMYQGARAQSLAFLDRFTLWVRVNYLSETERDNLVTRHYPHLSKAMRTNLNKYVSEHLEAFTGGTVLQPITPRGMLAIAEAATILGSLSDALNMVVLDRASGDDRSILKGIVDRVV